MNEQQENQPEATDKTPQGVTRRALMKAGWALPVVLASTSLPRSIFAQGSPLPPCPTEPGEPPVPRDPETGECPGAGSV